MASDAFIGRWPGSGSKRDRRIRLNQSGWLLSRPRLEPSTNSRQPLPHRQGDAVLLVTNCIARGMGRPRHRRAGNGEERVDAMP